MIPLAERVRPKNLDEFIGQEHLLGKDKALRKLLDQKKVFSMILWGPPGSGKTTLAKLIAEIVQADFFQISAVSSGVKELREIIQSAEQNFKRNKYTILFIDEIHRFNKAQQDALLHSIEIGLIILIGATTENPSFEIIPPLLSRCRVYVLKQHSIDDLKKILRLAISKDEYLCNLSFKFIDEDFLAQNSNGDARILLNTFEIAVELVKTKGDKLKINKEIIQEALQRKKNRL